MAIQETTRKTPRLPDELVDSTSFLLKRLGFSAKGRSMAAFEEVGHNPYHYDVLATLDEGHHETQAAIADALGYDRSVLVGLLDELESLGLVERRRDPGDRRRHIVSLTAAQAPLVAARAREAGVPVRNLGSTGGDALTLGAERPILVKSLSETFEAWLPRYMAGPS